MNIVLFLKTDNEIIPLLMFNKRLDITIYVKKSTTRTLQLKIKNYWRNIK